MLSSTTTDQLDRVTPEYDRLLADLRLGIPSQRAFDELEERAQAIAARARDRAVGGREEPDPGARSNPAGAAA